MATVALVYRLALHLLVEPGAALLAALVASLSVPLVRYAKTVNLDVPYVFWFTLSLVLLARILERHRWRDYLAFALAMACAIGTKDQAAGLYLALPLLLVPSLHAHRARTGTRRPSLARTALDPRLLVCLALALVAFALIHRLFHDPEQFRFHLRTLFGRGSQGRADFEASLGGQLAMAVAAGRHVVFCLGWPLLAAAVAGVVLAVRERRLRLLGPLLLVATYYVAFMAPVRYLRVRFFLPMAIVLSLFAALALWRCLAWRRLPQAVRLPLVAVVLLYSLALPVCLDAQMARDSRYQVEAWLAAHVAPGERWIAVGDFSQRNVRGDDPLPWRRLQTNGRRYLERVGAEYVVLNPDEAVETGAGDVLAALESGAWGHEVAFRHHRDPCGGLLDWSRVWTNLITVNPPIVVLRRTDATGPTDEELAARITALAPGEAPGAWAAVARDIAEAPGLAYREGIGPRTLAFGTHYDGWTRGALPAAIVLTHAGGSEPEPVRLELHYGAPAGSPEQRVRLLTPTGEHQVAIGAPGRVAVELPPLAPGERRAVVVLAARAWRAGRDPRNLGVQIAVVYG